VRSTMLVVAIAALGPLTAQSELTTAVRSCAPLEGSEVPGARLPVLKERRYVMSGAARPLLFWIKRDDIGLARIVWRRGKDGARGYELLVGTDPARAPRRLNRWGFVSEETLGASGSVLALMTGSQDTSYEDEADIATRGASGGEFRTILSRMQDGATTWRLARMRTPDALTVHQIADALECLQTGGSADVHRRAVSADVRSGFLVAVADLVDSTVAASLDRPGAPARRTAAVPYVFGEQMYELRVRDVGPVVVPYDGRQIPALKTSFQTRAVETGARTRFELTVGTTSDTAGVPLTIEWQPRWWLKVKLHLEAPDAR